MGLLSETQFEELWDWLLGPEGCDFRETVSGGEDFDCDHNFRRTQTWLERYGYDVDSNLAAFCALGAGCDCEIALNIEPSTWATAHPSIIDATCTVN